MRARCSLLLAVSLLATVAAGCGSSHRATVSRQLVVVTGHSHLSPSARAAIRRWIAGKRQVKLSDAWLGTGGCYLLVRDRRTHRLTARPRKHC